MRANRKILYVKVYQQGVKAIPAKVLHTYLLRKFKFRGYLSLTRASLTTKR